MVIYAFSIVFVLLGYSCIFCQVIVRVPGYLYFNGVHQKNDYQYFNTEPNQKNLRAVLDNLSGISQKELFNQTVAYVVLESVLLHKSLKELSITDLQRLNAILLYNLPIQPEHGFKGYLPGMFRTDFRVKARFSGYVWDQLNDEELKIWASLVIRMRLEDSNLDILYMQLDQKEKAVVNKLVTVYEPVADIQVRLQELLEDLYKNVEVEDTFSLAARMHYRLIQIHPFCDGNGRTSRLFMNLILMHYGCLPLFVDDKTKYVTIMRSISPPDYTQLIDYLRSRNISSAYSAIDLFGMSIYSKSDEKIRAGIKDIFQRIVPGDSESLDVLEELSCTVANSWL